MLTREAAEAILYEEIDRRTNSNPADLDAVRAIVPDLAWTLQNPERVPARLRFGANVARWTSLDDRERVLLVVSSTLSLLSKGEKIPAPPAARA